MKHYKCEACGRHEKTEQGPPKCMCGLPDCIRVMKPIQHLGENVELKEYLAE